MGIFHTHVTARRHVLRFVRNGSFGFASSAIAHPLRHGSSPQKVTRSLRLFGCKRPHDAYAALPTFCGKTRVHGFRGKGNKNALFPFAGIPVDTLFGKGMSRRCQPFAGTPAYTGFGEGNPKTPAFCRGGYHPPAEFCVHGRMNRNANTPVCHPALRRRISRLHGRFFGTSCLRMTVRGGKHANLLTFSFGNPRTRFWGKKRKTPAFSRGGTHPTAAALAHILPFPTQKRGGVPAPSVALILLRSSSPRRYTADGALVRRTFGQGTCPARP